MAMSMTKQMQQGRVAGFRATTRVSPRFLPSLPVKRTVLARAEAQQKSGFMQWADSVGMPAEDGVFGFTPFAEMWVGRWAQIGFVSSIVAEFFTGRGTLQQIGLPGDSMPMLIALIAVFGGASVAGTVNTVQRATSKQMTRSEMQRYRVFLGLHKEDEAQVEALRMKRRGDFTTPGNNEAAIAASRAEGSPVDAFLSVNDLAEGQQAAQEMKAEAAGPSAAALKEYSETMYFGAEGELAYARGIELTNGRWAMLGFLTAILVEAATGQGIIGQCISICKWSGLLGDKSGF